MSNLTMENGRVSKVMFLLDKIDKCGIILCGEIKGRWRKLKH